MNECEKYEALISSLIDSEISEEDKSALAKHLESCPRCKAMYDSFTAVSHFISDDLEDVPEGLHENIMAQIRREDIKKKNKPGLSRPLKAFIATAACIGIIVGVGFGMRPALNNADSVKSFSFSGTGSQSADFQPAEAASVLPEEPESAAEDMPLEEAALMALPGPEEAEEREENSAYRGLTGTEPFSDKAAPQLSMQSPAGAPLSPECFDALLELAGDRVLEAEAEAVTECNIMIGLSCEDGRSVTFYDYSSSLCYMLSSSEAVYAADCLYSDILDFLNQNT